MKSKLSLLTLSYIVTTSCLGSEIEVFKSTKMRDLQKQNYANLGTLRNAIAKEVHTAIQSIIEEASQQGEDVRTFCAAAAVPNGWIGYFINANYTPNLVGAGKYCYVLYEPKDEPQMYILEQGIQKQINGKGSLIAKIKNALEKIEQKYSNYVILYTRSGVRLPDQAQLIADFDSGVPAVVRPGGPAQRIRLYFKDAEMSALLEQ